MPSVSVDERLLGAGRLRRINAAEPVARPADRPAAWLTLDTADDDLGVWLRSVTAALRTVAHRVALVLEPECSMRLRPPDAFFFTTLLDDLVSLDRHAGAGTILAPSPMVHAHASAMVRSRRRCSTS